MFKSVALPTMLAVVIAAPLGASAQAQVTPAQPPATKPPATPSLSSSDTAHEMQAGLANTPNRTAVKERLAGPDRYGTAIAATKKQFADQSVNTVFITSGENYPDAISVNSLAALTHTEATKAAVLLSPTQGLTPEVLTEVTRILKPEGAIRLIGGEQAIAPAVETQLSRLLPMAKIKRIAGDTRVETAIAIAGEVQQANAVHEVIITPAEDYAISMVAAPLTAKHRAVHLMSPAASGQLHSAVQEWISKVKPAKVTVVGKASFLADYSHPGLARINELNPARVTVDQCNPGERCVEYSIEPTSADQVIAEKIMAADFADAAHLIAVSRDSAVDGIAAGQLAVMQSAPILTVSHSHSTHQRYGRILADLGKRHQVTFWAVGGEKVINAQTLERLADSFAQ